MKEKLILFTFRNILWETSERGLSRCDQENVNYISREGRKGIEIKNKIRQQTRQH